MLFQMAFPSIEHRRYFEDISDYFCPYTQIQLGPVGLDPYNLSSSILLMDWQEDEQMVKKMGWTIALKSCFMSIFKFSKGRNGP